MRRIVALLAAVALAGALTVPSLAKAPETTGTMFVGNFEMVSDGVVVGDIQAQIWPWTEDQAVSGWFSSRSDLGRSSAQVGVNSFQAHDGYNEVWFNALEWGTGGTSSVFTGHFRDYLDPAVPDEIDFYGRPIDDLTGGGAAGASLGSLYEFHFTVGKGAFVLTIH